MNISAACKHFGAGGRILVHCFEEVFGIFIFTGNSNYHWIHWSNNSANNCRNDRSNNSAINCRNDRSNNSAINCRNHRSNNSAINCRNDRRCAKFVLLAQEVCCFLFFILLTNYLLQQGDLHLGFCIRSFGTAWFRCFLFRPCIFGKFLWAITQKVLYVFPR